MRRWVRYRSTARRWALVAITLGLLGAVATTTTRAAPPEQTAQAGQATFQAKCVACHTIGGGKLVGPDLKGVTDRRSHDWLVAWITAPDKLIAQGDPTAKELVSQNPGQANLMPNLGLSAAEVEGVIAYLATQSSGGPAAAAQPAPQAAPQAAAQAGDPQRGREYFTGPIPFQNRGPACMACHSVGGIGVLGGGALGPDLTQATTKFGATGVDSILTTQPFPTMNAVWTPAPLTPQERADLVAFLEQAAVAERPSETIGILAVLAVVGSALLLLVTQVTWRNRLAGVRRPMLKRASHY